MGMGVGGALVFSTDVEADGYIGINGIYSVNNGNPSMMALSTTMAVTNSASWRALHRYSAFGEHRRMFVGGDNGCHQRGAGSPGFENILERTK
jgi:hypothetical protein